MPRKRVKIVATSEASAYWVAIDRKFVRLENGEGSVSVEVSEMEHLMTGVVEGGTDQTATFVATIDDEKIVELVATVPKKSTRDKGVAYAYFFVQ